MSSEVVVRHRHSGFTLVEMLVTVSIIAILVALLLPAMHSTRMLARLTQCQTHMGQFTKGWVAYPADHRRALVYGHPDNARGWVKTGAGYDPIKEGKLYPYVNNVKVYQCPEDPNGNERSFSIAAPMYGENWDRPYNGSSWAPQWGTDRYSNIVNPAKQLVFMEESDGRGWNIGSFVMYVEQSRWYRFVDYVSIWHGPKSNLSFADGHVEQWQWTDEDTIRNAIDKVFFLNDPGNEDWLKLRRVYRQLQEHDNVPLLF